MARLYPGRKLENIVETGKLPQEKTLYNLSSPNKTSQSLPDLLRVKPNPQAFCSLLNVSRQPRMPRMAKVKMGSNNHKQTKQQRRFKNLGETEFRGKKKI